MQISKNSWKKYSKGQEQIRTKAADLMRAWIVKHGIEDREAFVAYAAGLVDKYGEAAAAYACQMYDEIAEAEGADVAAAVPAEVATISEVAAAVNGALKTSVAGLLAVRAVERLVKQAGADTMLQNASRDSAEFAWIPDGGACPFCMGIGAEGWKLASKRVAEGQHADHIHASCNCEFAIRFNKGSNVSGYDPNVYKEKLAAQPENEIRREQDEENRAEINEQKRMVYAFNNENKAE